MSPAAPTTVLPSSLASTALCRRHLFVSLFVLTSLLVFASANTKENPDGTATHDLHFKIVFQNVTRFCNETKQILTVNGEFPGPTVYVRQGDQVNIKVSNHVNENVSIHWHGIRQMLTNWADGPAYITQCPLMPKKHYTHSFKIYREQGTLFWHAHIGWQRATVYGAFIIMPRKNKPYPFPIQPNADFPLVLGEWWKMDVNEVEKFGLASGIGYNISDALTINGQPGFLYNCSAPDAVVVNVKKGETYLLRIINAAMNFQLYFQIANHKLTVVETDCMLAKPYTTDIILLAPGQTADVLVTANQAVGTYAMAACVFSPPDPTRVPYPETPTTGLFVYDGAAASDTDNQLEVPSFPQYNDTSFALEYLLNLRSLNSEDHPEHVPQTVDEDLLFTVGYAVAECPEGQTCEGPQGGLVETSISNVTFELPSIPVLQAYYQQLHANDTTYGLPWKTSSSSAEETYEEDFPSLPLMQYNYTAANPPGWNLKAEHATKVKVLRFNSNVQLVLQNTRNLFFESHPFHLHGYNFFVVGAGYGNYDPQTHPSSFNLVDPPAMNTVAVPSGGWVALRFYTDNPGVWLMHCHFEMHTSWGMMMVFIVEDGATAKLPPPPKDYPKC